MTISRNRKHFLFFIILLQGLGIVLVAINFRWIGLSFSGFVFLILLFDLFFFNRDGNQIKNQELSIEMSVPLPAIKDSNIEISKIESESKLNRELLISKFQLEQSKLKNLFQSYQEVVPRFKELNSSIGEVWGYVETVYDLTGRVLSFSKKVYESSGDLLGQIEKTSSSIVKGRSAVGESIDSIRNIHSNSSKISESVAVINEISDLTNLLSLNATIEAARAGKEGRGFAVVAQEVSKLATKTGVTVDQINKYIKSSNQAIDTGMRISKVVEDEFISISQNAKLILDSFSQINGNLKEQSAFADKVYLNVEKLTETTADLKSIIKENSKKFNILLAELEQLSHIDYLTEISPS